MFKYTLTFFQNPGNIFQVENLRKLIFSTSEFQFLKVLLVGYTRRGVLKEKWSLLMREDFALSNLVGEVTSL